jgi:hypothetical protein
MTTTTSLRSPTQQEWGGTAPTIVLQFDERNSFLLHVAVSYNRRYANRTLVFNAEELREKVMEDLNSMGIWDAGGDRSGDDLAADKRAAIERLLQAAEAVPAGKDTPDAASEERK